MSRAAMLYHLAPLLVLSSAVCWEAASCLLFWGFYTFVIGESSGMPRQTSHCLLSLRHPSLTMSPPYPGEAFLRSRGTPTAVGVLRLLRTILSQFLLQIQLHKSHPFHFPEKAGEATTSTPRNPLSTIHYLRISTSHCHPAIPSHSSQSRQQPCL